MSHFSTQEDSLDWSLFISVLGAITAIISVVISVFSWRVSKSTLTHQMLIDLQKEYRSAEMLFAVRTLWEFYREHGKEKLVQAYEQCREQDRQMVSRLSGTQKLDAEKMTLHYQRRLVSHFYAMLANLYRSNVLPEQLLFEHWSQAGLRIIPDILVPIENNLRQVLSYPSLPPLDANSALLILYAASERHAQRRRV